MTTTTTDVIYHGTHHGTAGAGTVEVIENGRVTGLLHHVVKHSPTGFSWSYGGSGPADLARSLLIAALGNRALCPSCNGIRQIVWDSLGAPNSRPFDLARDDDMLPPDPDEDYEGPFRTDCCDCDDGYRLGLPYHDFKFKVVAQFGDEWRIARTEILTWLVDHHPGFFRAGGED